MYSGSSLGFGSPHRAWGQPATPRPTPRQNGKGRHAWCLSTLSTLSHFVEWMHFEEAEIGARNGQENRNRTLTTDPGRV
jgi:hypothetical protein